MVNPTHKGHHHDDFNWGDDHEYEEISLDELEKIDELSTKERRESRRAHNVRRAIEDRLERRRLKQQFDYLSENDDDFE